jgi:predicted phage terminase large subunit-like protein
MTDETTTNPYKQYVPLDKAERYWIEKSRTSPYYFIWYMTGKKPAEHHKIWLDSIFHPERKRINIVAARESAKTTITVYSMAWYIAKNPLSTNAIISVAAKQAEDRLRMLRSIFENDRFKNVFPHIHIDRRQGQPDTQNELNLYSTENGMNYAAWRSLVTRHGSTKDSTLFVAGAGGKNIIGRRFSGMLLLDDIIDETMLSDAAQAKMMQYIMQTLIPCVTETGKVVTIGTRWMIGDIYERLMNNPEWRSIVIPAILYDREGNPHSYWKEFWSLDKLERKRREMNDDVLFRIMYLCDPTATTSGMFKHSDFNLEHHQLERGWEERIKQVYITTDFAITLKSRSDFSVFFAVAVLDDDSVVMLDGMRFKAEAMQLADAVYEFYTRIQAIYGQVQAIYTENVAFQGAISQIILTKYPTLPINKVSPKGDKAIRASVVEQYVKRGRLIIPENIPFREQIVSEWVNFPNHRHDDTLDAMSLFFQAANMSIMGAQMRTIKTNVLTF